MSQYGPIAPIDYLALYHTIYITDPNDGVPYTVDITSYGSGWDNPDPKDVAKYPQRRWRWGKQVQAEAAVFTSALRKRHHGSVFTPCGIEFYFDQKPVNYIPDDEVFFAATINRTFNGKGSPDEITDVIRLAITNGRVGPGADANGVIARESLSTYINRFITTDCNGLAGNYYGIDPQTRIDDYCSNQRARRTLGSLARGDALVTITDGGKFEHIALVNEVIRKTDGGAASGTIDLHIVEWGAVGTFHDHNVWGKGIKVGLKTSPATKGGTFTTLAYSPEEGKSRYFFAPPVLVPAPRRWGMGTNPAA